MKSQLWEWEENQSFVPIMVPKFTLIFGILALLLHAMNARLFLFQVHPPCQLKYSSAKIKQYASLADLSFRRINSILVPQSFCNGLTRFAESNKEHFFFVWKMGKSMVRQFLLIL